MNAPILIAGASLAGLSAARELRKQGYLGAIQIVDPDNDAPYRRPALSKGMVTGKQQPDEIRMPWPNELLLERVTGHGLIGLDVAGQTVLASGPGGDDLELPYSHLVIATGSTARAAYFDGPSHDIITIRNMSDGVEARTRLSDSHRVVIIGGGFVGLEVAAAARSMGKEVTIVEVAPIPLAHAVGVDLGQHLVGIHRSRGVEVLCGVSVNRILGEDRAAGVVLEDGRVIEADLVVGAVGSAPNVSWLAESGLDISGGVVCDQMCVPTNSKNSDGSSRIVAAGDVAGWFNPLYGRQMRVEHWTNAIEQATYAARQVIGVADQNGFSSAPYFWSEQFDLRIQSVGSAFGHDQVNILEQQGDTLVVAYGREGTLVAVGGVNTGAILPKFRPQIEARVPLDSIAP